MSQFKQYKRKLRWKSSIRKEGAGMDPSCPECGSPMYWRDAAGLTGMHPEGAWECSNQRCWHMLTPGNLAPDAPPPDLDTGHSDLTLPDHWSGCKMAEIGPGNNPTTCPYCGSPDTGVSGQRPTPGYSRSPWQHTQYVCRACGQHFVPGAIEGIEQEDLNPQMFDHPDPLMDTEPGTQTFPEEWNR